MRLGTTRLAVVLVGLVTVGAASAQDVRKPLEMPAEVEAIFKAQMLGHVVSLDAIVTALGEGDYEAAASAAEEGVAVRREEGADASGSATVGGAPGPGVGIAAYVPESFMVIAHDFRDAGARFAEQARAMPAVPTDGDHRALMQAFADVTNQCRICHDRYVLD